MKIDKLILGDYKTNCYVISHQNVGFVIDPAFDGQVIHNFLVSRDIQLSGIFLTHGHQDHIGAVDYLYEIYRCPIRAHIKEKDILKATNPAKLINFPEFKGIKVNSPINYFDGDFNSFNIDGVIIDAILTSGHSEGSTTYVLRDFKRIFSGDTVMKGSIGRCDFPTSNKQDMEKSIELYKGFADDCKLHPGHGDSTTIKQELENNPYFKK